MVMAIWLIAREANAKLPRRLIYVVDRRTVIDQATSLAEGFANVLVRTTSRSLLCVDNLLTIANGLKTYRSRPLLSGRLTLSVRLCCSQAIARASNAATRSGILGQDSLLVLDEAHLSKPFDRLVTSISKFQSGQGSPMKVIRMSATGGESKCARVFSLDTDPSSQSYDLKSEPHPICGRERNQTVLRYNAKKTLRIDTVKDVVDSIASAALEVKNSHPDSRIVIFLQSPKAVYEVRKAICKKDKSAERKIAMLTGTMRGLERDELVKPPITGDQHERRVMQRFLTAENDSSHGECYLISTGAGEVGFDLNADHMVCDATSMDSFVQRIGRVNRRGTGDATIQLFAERANGKEGKAKKLEGIELAIANTLALLHAAMNEDTQLDVSPKNLACLKKSDQWSTTREGEAKSPYELACSPDPMMVELTEILLDNWSIPASPKECRETRRRPVVARIDEEQSQTTIAWRAELDLPFNGVDCERAFAAIFAKHRIRPHESLTINTRYLIDEFFKKLPRPKAGEVDPRSIRCAIRFPQGQVLCRTIDQLMNAPNLLFTDATLIFPASFGGLHCGMLDAGSVPKGQDDETTVAQSLDIADHPGYEADRALQGRLRVLLKRDFDSGDWRIAPFPSNATLPDSIDPDTRERKTTPIVTQLQAAGFRVRRVQPIRLDDEGEPVESLVCLAPEVAGYKSEDQCLDEHVNTVVRHAIRITDNLQLPENHPARVAAIFAATWHDEGKKAVVWQRFANNADPEHSNPLGKVARARDPKSLRGYRHELGSLLRLQHPERFGISSTLPEDPDVRDLALHLIATHHGAGRPHFDMAVYDHSPKTNVMMCG